MCTVGIRYYNSGYHRSSARPEADGEKDACLLSLVIGFWVTVTQVEGTADVEAQR